MVDRFYNRVVDGDCISSWQIDELVGLARGLAADSRLNQPRWNCCRSGSR
jgi:hypothetical protein